MLKAISQGILLTITALCCSGTWADAAAQPEPKTAHAVVEQVTNELVSVTQKEKGLLDTDPEAYFGLVEGVLEPVVDFPYIARNVMGPYWESASAEQRTRFVKTFKSSLIETYAKGMANYSDLDIEILPPAKDVQNERRVGVVQEITGPDGTNRVSYTMALNREGQWKLINMVLNGVNLGKTFRNQFAQAAKQHEGDIDAVIKNWSAEA